ncbi:glucuronate isomerase [Carboxylicivirga sp. M1479]|uniref:glucuronate isomerase n=1 Tax=Carboxylicivirga sp. M1479 TaxID=2594476 RepID=UPI0011776F83|nr:glucuronate isomerase [Carboxylicivirga sp. M1479]TRX66070.1 glucuronate isomerase [Carboxylicivirga sp. M1479]
MNQFINEDFILSNNTAKELYCIYSSGLPIVDFHNHLNPRQIAEDFQFDNLGQVWLEGDHYKWRAMRINGVDEHSCTGAASDKEKFMAWAATVPNTLGNPLYHWTHLELARYFDIYDLLSPSTAEAIFEETQSKLRSKNFSTRNLLKMQNVEMVGTTDDPADDLRYHQQLKEEGFDIKVLPSFRADNVLKTDEPQGYVAYLEKLGAAADVNISDLDTLLEALDKRHAFFHAVGCRVSDSGPYRFYYSDYTLTEINSIIKKLLSGQRITEEETEKYNTCVMAELARLNHKRGWVQQYHVGPLRNNSIRKFNELGADTGFDSMGAVQNPEKMAAFLNHLDKEDQLCKTILYNLNPADNEMMLTMCGNFNDGSVAAKVQYGAAWWFLDQKVGMEKHLNDLSVLGLLRHFVGMVTDSRSFLSFPRHEYFRRIACNYIGEQVEKGLIPDDESILKPLVEGISYNNAKNYFDF